jgi:hypothetical protein
LEEEEFDGANITRLEYQDKEIILIATAMSPKKVPNW